MSVGSAATAASLSARAVLALAVALACLAAARSLAAQETERARRWDVAVDLGLNAAKGNTDLTVLSTSLGVKHLVTEEFRLEWSGSIRYGESEGEVVARNVRTQLSFDLHPDAVVSPFFYADMERDPFRRMRLRSDGGAGAKYTLWRRGSEEASLSIAGLYSRQAFFPHATGEITPARTDARFSGRGRVRRHFGDARVEHTSFFRPVLDELNDYTYDATTRVSTKLNDMVSFTFTHTYRHNSVPPDGVGREDQSFQAGIRVQF
ncbi:MAG TPA: DUF481 domain-containing protein [Longimicrobiales bacterium]|nr:DUF481 domain-containing protein [Longimicrobiales bacterium]